MLRGERDIAMEAVRVGADAAICGRPVGELDCPGRKLLLFGLITATEPDARDAGQLYALDDGFWLLFKPAARVRVKVGDVLVVFGYEYSLTHLRRELGAAGRFGSGLS